MKHETRKNNFRSRKKTNASVDQRIQKTKVYTSDKLVTVTALNSCIMDIIPVSEPSVVATVVTRCAVVCPAEPECLPVVDFIVSNCH